MNSHKTSKFAKVFSLESFQLYSMLLVNILGSLHCKQGMLLVNILNSLHCKQKYLIGRSLITFCGI